MRRRTIRSASSSRARRGTKSRRKSGPKDDVKPEAVYEDLNIFEIDPTQDFEINCETQLVTVKDGVNLPAITAFRLLAAKLKRLGRNNPILLKDCINFEPVPLEPKIALLRASVVIGSLLADGIGDAILVRGEAGGGQSLRLAYNILQAAGCRQFQDRLRRVSESAGGRCSICRPSPRASRRARSISRA